MAVQGNGNVPGMTAEEFNQRVKAWGETVRSRSLGSLVAETNVYSGGLRARLKAATNTDRGDGLAHAVAFKFLRYGVFVAYGVGNGYIRQGGRVVRGSHDPNRQVTPGPIRRRPVDCSMAISSSRFKGWQTSLPTTMATTLHVMCSSR